MIFIVHIIMVLRMIGNRMDLISLSTSSAVIGVSHGDTIVLITVCKAVNIPDKG